MAIDVLGQIMRVTIAAQYPDAQIEMNNLTYVATAVGGADTRALLGVAVRNKFVAQWLPVMSPTSNIYGNRTLQLAPLPAAASTSVANPIVGTGVGNSAPTQARPILRFTTALAGRPYRGRLYLFTPILTCTDALAYPTAAIRAAVVALGASLQGANVVGGTTWSPCIAHKPSTPGAPWTSTPITGTVDPGMFGTQRRSGNTGRLNPTPW